MLHLLCLANSQLDILMGCVMFFSACRKNVCSSRVHAQVASEMLHLLCLPKSQLDSLMGWDSGLRTTDQVVAALKKSKHLSNLTEVQVKTMLQVCVCTCVGACVFRRASTSQT